MTKQEQNRMSVRLWKKKHPEAILDQHLRRAYGITLGDYKVLLVSQDNKCLICGRLSGEGRKRLGVDHDHSTGKVRGLLCGNCNSAMGKFQDSPSLLHKAADYLEAHKNKN